MDGWTKKRTSWLGVRERTAPKGCICIQLVGLSCKILVLRERWLAFAVDAASAASLLTRSSSLW